MCGQFVDNNNMESRAATTPKASSMQYGWHEIVNNTVHCFQTPHNVALIVEQLSNYNMTLRKQTELRTMSLVNKTTQ